ncbi:UNVERIFIED_CONTAM: hypothetical protein FKN15_004692 [Acipenser sinensis]
MDKRKAVREGLEEKSVSINETANERDRLQISRVQCSLDLKFIQCTRINGNNNINITY